MAPRSGESAQRILCTVSGTRARPSKIPSCPAFCGASSDPTVARGRERGSKGRGCRSHFPLHQERKSLNFVWGTCAWARACRGKAPFGILSPVIPGEWQGWGHGALR